MTVSSTTVKKSYNGNGSTAGFTYDFLINSTAELKVIIRSSAGTETIKSLSSHYNISDSAGSGTVTFTSGNIPASGETVILIRDTNLTQGTDYVENDPFPSASHESALDKLTLQVQEVQEELDRAIKLSRTNTMTSTQFTVGATDRASKILAFDSSGEISVTQELGTVKGNWGASTTYAIRDIVKDTSTNNIFIALTAHTSSGSQPLTTNTDSAKWSLLVDAASATSSASAASGSASTATTKANEAAASASTASGHKDTATTKASEAASSANAAANSASAAAASADAFDDVYLGSKSSDPSTDNDGDALAAGKLYFNTTTDLLRVYTGSAWQNAAVDTTGFITLSGTQTLTNKTLTTPKIGTSILDTNGNELAKLTATGSAVNEFTVANAASGGNPTLSSTGGDSNIDLDLLAKGEGHVTVRGNTNSGAIQFNCESNSHGQIVKSQPHSASVTNELLLPAGASSTLVSLVSTDTLTNKTLTAPKINEDVVVTSTATELNYSDLATLGTTAASKVFTADANNLTKVSGAVLNIEDTLTDGSTIAWNVINSPVAKVQLGGNRTLSAPSGTTPASGQFVSLLIIQDGTGSRSLTFNAVYEFTGDVAPVLTTTASKGDLFVFRYNGSKWLEVGRNLNLTLS